MAEFVLNVQDIDEVGKDYVFPVTQAWLAQALSDTGVRADSAAASGVEGRLELHVQRQGADLLLHGHLRSALLTECARCLGDARVPVDLDVGNLLTARGADLHREPDEIELTPEDMDREFFSGDRVVLDDMVREHLLLEVPIKPLCREDCPGIPVPESVAGPADLRSPASSGAGSSSEGGVDPRLAPLMKLVGTLAPTEE